jgi:hypothetical protein
MLTIPPFGTKDPGGPLAGGPVATLQGWLWWHAQMDPTKAALCPKAVDGDFGAWTDAALRAARAAGLDPAHLDAPLERAVQVPATPPPPWPDAVRSITAQHVTELPAELTVRSHLAVKVAPESNTGPWVRRYTGGHEGTVWRWCAGAAWAVLEQAAAWTGHVLPIKPSLQCNVMADRARAVGRLVPASEARPGDAFLAFNGKSYYHTGVILDVVDGAWKTAEGNSNADGSENGWAFVIRRRTIRHFAVRLS